MSLTSQFLHVHLGQDWTSWYVYCLHLLFCELPIHILCLIFTRLFILFSYRFLHIINSSPLLCVANCFLPSFSQFCFVSFTKQNFKFLKLQIRIFYGLRVLLSFSQEYVFFLLSLSFYNFLNIYLRLFWCKELGKVNFKRLSSCLNTIY